MEIKISGEALSKKRLMVATPMYGGMCAGMYTRSLVDLAALCGKWGIQLQLYFLFNESLITRARNYCADVFLRSDATHLMFIDADIGFNPNDVLALLALMDENADDNNDVMCGPYPKKCISWEKIKQAVDLGVADRDANLLERFVGDFVFNPLNNEPIHIEVPTQVLESGTGFMMVRRSAFEKIRAVSPELLYKPDHARTEDFDGSREIMAYFMDPIDRTNFEAVYRDALENILSNHDQYDSARSVAEAALAVQETKSKRLLSEDYFFCQKVREVGGGVWLCPWMEMKHVGSYVFGGSLRDLAAIGAHATVDVDKVKGGKTKARTNTKSRGRKK